MTAGVPDGQARHIYPVYSVEYRVWVRIAIMKRVPKVVVCRRWHREGFCLADWCLLFFISVQQKSRPCGLGGVFRMKMEVKILYP